MNLKALAAVGLLVVGVGAVGVTVLGVGGGSDTSVTYRTQQATTTTVQQTAVASGSLTAAVTYDLAFGEAPVARDVTATSTATSTGSTATASSTAASTSSSSGSTSTSMTVTWPVTAVDVEVGDVVSAGSVLATADSASAELAVDLAEANLAAAEQQKKDDLKGGTALSRAAVKDQVTAAQTALSNAKASYSNTVAQNNLKLEAARQAVSDANDKRAADREADAPQATIDADTAAVKAAKASLAAVKLQVAAGNRSASNQVTSAKLSLKSAERTYDSATSSADDATLAADDVAIAEAEQALADAEAALAAATLVAPIDGRITAVNVAVGDDASGTAIELQSTQMAVSLSVTEDDILSIAVGQAATVAISATDATASGTVTSIDPVASTSGTSSVVSYTVVVTLDDSTGSSASPSASTAGATAAATAAPAAATAAPAAAVIPTSIPLAGMSAEVTVVIDQVENATAVPAIALSGTGGTYTVRVLAADGTVETRSVEVGLVTSDLAQITSGLVEGESVVTGSSADRITSSTTTTTTTGGRSGLGGLDGGPPAGAFQGGGQ
jgi:multidrug efflux pump subunit AcrA (membrane-fusion protein)